MAAGGRVAGVGRSGRFRKLPGRRRVGVMVRHLARVGGVDPAAAGAALEKSPAIVGLAGNLRVGGARDRLDRGLKGHDVLPQSPKSRSIDSVPLHRCYDLAISLREGTVRPSEIGGTQDVHASTAHAGDDTAKVVY